MASKKRREKKWWRRESDVSKQDEMMHRLAHRWRFIARSLGYQRELHALELAGVIHSDDSDSG